MASRERAAAGAVFMGVVAAAFFVALSHWENGKKTTSALSSEVETGLATAGATAVVSAIAWTVGLFVPPDAVAYAAGYPAMAAQFVGSFALGILGQIKAGDDTFYLTLGGLIGGAVAAALVPHTPEEKSTESKGGTGRAFVVVQAVLGLLPPFILIFVFTDAGLKKTDPVPYWCGIGGLVAGIMSFAAFNWFFIGGRRLWVLWLAILLDVGALGLIVATAGYLFATGGAVAAEHQSATVWLLFAAGVTKLFHWILSHFWSSRKKLKEN